MAESTKKKAAKKKTGSKKATKKKTGRKTDGKGTVVFFMGKLVQAGYLGKEIPKGGKDQSDSQVQNQKAADIRRMAEKLARQTRKFGDEDVPLGGGDDE